MPLTFDLRDLAPPEPMQRILDALEDLPDDEQLTALTPLYPAPLLAILQAEGYDFEVHTLVHGYRVTIRHGDATDMPHAS